MNENEWIENLERELKPLTWMDKNYAPTPTVEELDAFEAESGFRLPSSYRRFALAYGAGTLVASMATEDETDGEDDDEDEDYDEDTEFRELYQLYVPNCVNEHHELADYNRLFHERFFPRDELAEDFTEPDMLERLIVFMSEIDGYGWVGWDPKDIRDNEHRECGIYAVGRHANALRFVAASFAELLTNEVLLDERNWAKLSGFYKAPEVNWLMNQYYPAYDLR